MGTFAEEPFKGSKPNILIWTCGSLPDICLVYSSLHSSSIEGRSISISKHISAASPCERRIKSASHQPFELLLGEAHVLGRHAVVEVKAGVEDQRVVCVQGVVGLVLPEPVHRQHW